MTTDIWELNGIEVPELNPHMIDWFFFLNAGARVTQLGK